MIIFENYRVTFPRCILIKVDLRISFPFNNHQDPRTRNWTEYEKDNRE